MGESNKTKGQFWRIFLRRVEKYELRNLLMESPVKGEAKPTNRAIEALDEDDFDPPTGLGPLERKEWLRELNDGLVQSEERHPIRVTSENIDVILRTFDKGCEQGAIAGAVTYRLRHAIDILELAKKREIEKGRVERIEDEAKPSNGETEELPA